MNSLRYLFALFVLVSTSVSVVAQDVAAKLNQAESAYSAKNLDDARFALQEALNEINHAIGKDILEILPATMGGMAANKTEDNISGAAGFAGLFVNRSYGKEQKTASIEIMGDSPMLTSLNALLSLPMMGASDPNQKRIKVSGYKALMQKETGENSYVAYTIQVPMNQTLLTFKVNGVEAESEVISMVNTIPVDQVAKKAQ